MCNTASQHCITAETWIASRISGYREVGLPYSTRLYGSKQQKAIGRATNTQTLKDKPPDSRCSIRPGCCMLVGPCSASATSRTPAQSHGIYSSGTASARWWRGTMGQGKMAGTAGLGMFFWLLLFRALGSGFCAGPGQLESNIRLVKHSRRPILTSRNMSRRGWVQSIVCPSTSSGIELAHWSCTVCHLTHCSEAPASPTQLYSNTATLSNTFSKPAKPPSPSPSKAPMLLNPENQHSSENILRLESKPSEVQVHGHDRLW